MNKTSNFAFLREHDPIYFQLTSTAEGAFANDPNTTLIKLRQFGEALARDLATRFRISFDERISQADLLFEINREVRLDPTIRNLFHTLRIEGNKATHAFRTDHREALNGLQVAHALAVWFHKACGKEGPGFKASPFVPPNDPSQDLRELQAQIALLKTQLQESQAQQESNQDLALLLAQEKTNFQQLTEQMAEQLFNLAETYYPDIFPVTGDYTHAFYGFFYRHYPATGVYLAVVHDASYGYELNGVYAAGGQFGSAGVYGGPVTQFVPAPAPLPTMQVGELPFTIVYAATNFGIDGRSVSATFASDNTLDGYRWSDSEAPGIGTLSNAEASGTQTVQIGRWTNGTFAGRFYAAVDDTHSLTLTPNQGFHYAIATIPATLPCSGSKTYALAAATRPTLNDGSASSGSVDQLTATVTFNGANAPTVSVAGTVTVDGVQRNFSGSGANINAAWKEFFINPVTAPGFTNANLFGTFGGADSAQLGLAIAGLRAIDAPAGKNVHFAARLTQTESSSVACN